MYHIETSIGRLYFESDNLSLVRMDKKWVKEVEDNDIVIKPVNDAYSVIRCVNIKFTDKKLASKFMSGFVGEPMIENTTNGYFLEINLDDGFYGTPEYKIFD